MLEVALTVFVWGAVLGGALVVIFACQLFIALTERAKAQTRTEVMMQTPAVPRLGPTK